MNSCEVNKQEFCGILPDCSSMPQFSIDDCPESVPAAGYRGESLNNVGSNGNYWTSSPNESNSNNAYNLNFNSGNHNVNNNNRNWGHTVRPVSEFAVSEPTKESRHFSITPEQLLVDLYRAYKGARRHKRGKEYQLKFELCLEENLVSLRDELYSGSYEPLPSTCFVILDPKMREVFAADFRDRIVHHLFYNYTHELFERTFIHDSYSCIPKRGTHFGIKRLEHHIRSVSANYTRPCYVLKLDIRGYFMSIDRGRLLTICRRSLERMRCHASAVKDSGEGRKTWGESIDYQLVDYLLERIVLVDPSKNCRMVGSPSDWAGLPPEKSIFHSRPGCGLPIGNLSSQLFSNVYLNELDQYVKRVLGCRHYGRYVDDAYMVSNSKSELRRAITEVDGFLSKHLGLSLNHDKVRIFNAYYGVEFLGAYLRPFRTYTGNRSLKRIKRGITRLRRETAIVSEYARNGSSTAGSVANIKGIKERLWWMDREGVCRVMWRRIESAVNSWLGVMSHGRSYRLRRVLFGYQSGLSGCGRFSRDWLHFRRNGH